MKENNKNSKEQDFVNLKESPKTKNNDNPELKQNNVLKKLIDEISNSNIENNDNLLYECNKYLKIIYDGNFRHSYSFITKEILLPESKIDKDNLKSILSTILTNITLLIEKQNDTNIIKGLHKLKDHINLEHVRLKFIEEEYGKEINEIKEKAGKLEENLKDKAGKLEKDIEQSKKDLENSKINYVTILGIFSAFVISFTSGIGFSNQILSNVGKVDFPILLMIVSIIAIFIGNIIFALFWFILYLNNKVKPFSKKGPLKNFTFGFNVIFIIIFLISILISICLYNSSNKITNDKILENNKTNVIDLNNTKTK